MAFATMKTTMRAAIGTKVIVVVSVATQIKRNIVKNASAWIVNTLTKKTSVLGKKSRANAETPTLAMECVMMSTTMPVATGIKVIAVDQPKPTKSHIARSANAKIVMSQQRNVPKKAASAVLLIGKAIRTVMITTITARAIGMAEIAVGKKWYINIARLASVWTPPNKRAHKNADHRLGRTMVSATTTTTIVGVDGTKVIVAATLANRIRKSTAKSASVWIPKTQISHQRRRCVLASAVTQIGWATVFVTLATTTVAASGTKMIVA